jgi:hypothetical protein
LRWPISKLHSIGYWFKYARLKRKKIGLKRVKSNWIFPIKSER